MSKDYFRPFIAHVSEHQVPPVKGVIRGVKFVDTPPLHSAETVIVSRASWEALKRQAGDAKASAYVACAISGISLALALIMAVNFGH